MSKHKYTYGEIEGQSQVINITLGFLMSRISTDIHLQVEYVDYVNTKLEELIKY